MFPKRHKYSAKKWTNDGHSFASKLESSLYDLIKLLEKGKKIELVRNQPRVHLTRAQIVMIPDFLVINKDTNQHEWWEAKGFETDMYRLKRKLWMFYGPGKLVVWKKSRQGLTVVEEIEPKEKLVIE